MRCPAPRVVFFGANTTLGASVRNDTSGCTSTTWRGSGTASQSRIFGPMWKVCRLIALPVSRRATANASSGVAASSTGRGGAGNTDDRARPRRRAHATSQARGAVPTGRPSGMSTPTAAQPAVTSSTSAAEPTTDHATSPPVTRATTQPVGTPSTPAIGVVMRQDEASCASTSVPTTPASSSRPT